VLLGAYEQYVIGQAAVLPDEITAESKSTGLLQESGADDRDLAADSTRLTWQDQWLELCIYGGRYWDRTSDLFGVNEALSR
jgi:hypothetical protein